jgi:hypothetical protein
MVDAEEVEKRKADAEKQMKQWKMKQNKTVDVRSFCVCVTLTLTFVLLQVDGTFDLYHRILERREDEGEGQRKKKVKAELATTENLPTVCDPIISQLDPGP